MIPALIPKPRRRGPSRRAIFTIIEVVVGLATFTVLILVVLSAGGPGLTFSKRAKAANMANQLQAAALGYYTEYSAYPVPSGVTKDYILTDTDGARNGPASAWGPLIECFSGMIKPTNGESSHETTFGNTRAIAFLTLKVTDVSSGDQPLNPLPPNSTSLYFNMAMDSDYDGLLGDPQTSSAGCLPDFTKPTLGAPPPMTGSTKSGVAVWANCNPKPSVQNSNFWVHTY